MSRTYNTTAIILKRRDYQENDRLFCMYTKDYGKLDVVAKGTKKISSKLNSYLEPFYFIKVMIAKGKVIDKLANCDLINSYDNLRNDLIGYYLLSYIGEVTDGLIAGQTFLADKFNLLQETLTILNQNIAKDNFQPNRLLFLTHAYCLKLLNLLGYQPEIKRCLLCHQGILLTKNVFDFAQGGIICESCKKVCLIEDYIIVSDGVIKLLQSASSLSLDNLLTLVAADVDFKQFNAVVNRLILVNLERPLKSYELIKKTID